MEYTAYYNSPIGEIETKADDKFITSLDFVFKAKDKLPEKLNPVLKQCRKELDLYFRGKLKTFSVKLKPEGTDFQKSIWKAITSAKHGKTLTYKQIAEKAGNAKSVRAAGTACGKNPIAIIIPCHRIIGSDGKLTGYAGGLWRKEYLLKLEAET